MFTSDQSVLIVIDVQGKLASVMHERDRTVKNIHGLIKAAHILDIPIIWTEQVPDKIGPTVEEVASLLHYMKPIPKASFSCWQDKNFVTRLKETRRRQMILTGIEAHVCVYQTAADLSEEKYTVQVVADAVSSRTQENKALALDRMKHSGISLTSTEMIVCELLRTSEHPRFKEVLSLIK